jgi:DNA-binding NarL/FixJ family response regulator
LVLDDDAGARADLRRALAGVGVSRITEAGLADGDILRRPMSYVDVVLSEISFTAGSGLSLLKAIRLGRVPQIRSDTPFIIVSAAANTAMISAAAQLDATAFIIKPVAPERLRAALLRGRNHACLLDPVRYASVRTHVVN